MPALGVQIRSTNHNLGGVASIQARLAACLGQCSQRAGPRQAAIEAA